MVDLVMGECGECDGAMTGAGEEGGSYHNNDPGLSKCSLHLHIFRIIIHRMLHSRDHLCSPLSGYFFNKHEDEERRGGRHSHQDALSTKLRSYK